MRVDVRWVSEFPKTSLFLSHTMKIFSAADLKRIQLRPFDTKPHTGLNQRGDQLACAFSSDQSKSKRRSSGDVAATKLP
jgi:hypothetical protein